MAQTIEQTAPLSPAEPSPSDLSISPAPRPRPLGDEWLVTNGLGGYASGTISGACTRRYHGLLIAALPTPLGRFMMLNHLLVEIVTPDGTPWADEARIAREGILLYCPVIETSCMDALNRRAAAAPRGRRVEVEISRSFVGIPGPITRYAIVAIPPR